MSEREQDFFLWNWTRRRSRGLSRTLLIGAGVGAIGGLVFALLMLYGMTASGGSFYVDEEEAGPILGAIARALGPTGFLFFLSIPAFAGLGAFLSHFVWGRMERRYHFLIEHGARMPADRPVMTRKERTVKWAVIGGFALLCLFLLGMLIREINHGTL